MVWSFVLASSWTLQKLIEAAPFSFENVATLTKLPEKSSNEISNCKFSKKKVFMALVLNFSQDFSMEKIWKKTASVHQIVTTL